MDSLKASVSIIVPVFNRAEFLGECIDSILNQDYQGLIEIIISDDGSTDSSLDIARSYGNAVIILTKPNDCIEQGAASTRNRGLEIVKSELIAFLDSDDYWFPGHLNRMVQELENTGDDVGYAFCRCKRVSADPKNSVIVSDWTRNKMTQLDKEYHVLARSYCINTNTILIKKTALDSVGIFNTTLANGEDSDMWIRISEKYKGKFVDFYGAAYRADHGSMQLTKIGKTQKSALSLHIYISALERNCLKKHRDSLRLYLIVRALLYCHIDLSRNQLVRFGQHVAVMIKLLALFPFASFKYVVRRII